MAVIKLPEYGQHLVFAGTTGAGKSWLAQKMLERFDRYFVIDTQDSLNIPGVKIDNPKMLKMKLLFFPRIRYVPKPEFLTVNNWNYVFRSLLESSTKRKPKERIIYIDEIYHIGYGTSFPSWLSKSVTTARQRKLSFWISTQRPSQIPIPVLTECAKFYIFYLGYEEDIKKMSKFCRRGGLKEALMETQYDYSFVEVDRKTGDFQKMTKLKNS